MRRRRWRRRLLLAGGLAALLVLLAHPLAGASDVWGNVGPASPFGAAGLDGRYPLGSYGLDEHFTAVSAGVFSGVDVSGVPPMIAYFLAEGLWLLTSWLANTLIDLFGFAFSLDLVSGSDATGGAGALAPVARAIHSVYSSVFGGPWLVVAVAIAGCWAMWRALVQRRYAETAGQLAMSLIYVVVALFFVFQPAQTIGAASAWTNEMSGAFLSVAKDGSPGSGEEAKQAGADQLFSLLVFQPWSVLEFGGVEHCVKTGTGSSESDPISEPVRPLPAEASRRLEAGEEVIAGGKTCVNDARKYSSHFLRFGLGTDERNAEYEALDHGDSSKLPEADKPSAGYKLSAADKPATDAMEAGGQYQRLLIAVVVFVAELGAFCLLGALALGVILAQVLLLLWLAFSPVALVAAAIPGRGHDFFKGWLSRLASLALRKAAYSLILAILLAVCAALSEATSQLGWLMSFGLQTLLLWTVFFQRKTLAESLVGIATGPSSPGREGALRVLALYYGARGLGRATRGPRRAARSMAGAPVSTARGGGRRPQGGTDIPGPGEAQSAGAPDRRGAGRAEAAAGERPAATSEAPKRDRRARPSGEKGEASPARRAGKRDGDPGSPRRADGRRRREKPKADEAKAEQAKSKPAEAPAGQGRQPRRSPGGAAERQPERRQPGEPGELAEELRADRDRARESVERQRAGDGSAEPAPPKRRPRKGPRPGDGGGER